MDFEIYVLGDVRLFADTLNGIAMMFTVAEGDTIDLWASNTNSMGLGMGAFLGMLLAICMLMYNAAFKQKFDYRAIILPLILYIVLTVPKVTVNVVDAYYRDGAQTVANVPLGLALPMSAISTIAFNATEKLETVFQVPSNGSFTKITEDGFVMPLKLLHSLRYTGLTMRDAYPNVTESVAEVVKICLTNNLTFDELEYSSSSKSMKVFFSALNDPIAGARLVKIYPSSNPTGQVVSCSMAASYIENSVNAYINGAGTGLLLISPEEYKTKNLRTDIEKILASNNGNTGSRNLTNISSMRILDDIQSLTNVSNEDALNFVAATVFNPQLSTATECVIASDNRSTARCFSYATAQEQWKEKSAAEASGFLSIMRDGQNLLILLSVTLFPIMVLIVVLQGMGGLKVVMSYLLYTISAYMWIPVAAMINYYTQVQLDDELKKWASRVPAGTDVAATYLSLANAPLFYDAISKKLALANSVMASVPMICMGLFGGMLMTMNRLADKMNPQSGFNASTNTPPVMERGALAKVGSSVSFDGMNASGKLNGLPELATFSHAKESALQSQKAQTFLDSASKQAAKAYGEAVTKGRTNSTTSQLADQVTESIGFDRTKTESFAKASQAVSQSLASIETAEKIASNATLTDADKKTIERVMGMDASAALSKNPLAVAGKLQQMGVQSLAETVANGVSTGLDVSKVSKHLGMNTDSWNQSSLSSESSKRIATSALIATTTKATQENSGYTKSDDKTNTVDHTLAEARSNMQSFTQSVKAASTFQASSEELLNMDNATRGKISETVSDAFHEALKTDASLQAEYNKNPAEFSNISGAHNAGLSRQINAMNNASDDTRRILANKLNDLNGGGVGSLLGMEVNGDHIPNVDPKAQTVREEVLQGTAHAKTLTGPDTSVAEINAEAKALEGNVGGQQSRIGAIARTQPTQFAAPPDAYGAANAAGDAALAKVRAANTENNVNPHFPLNDNGENVRISLNSNAGGLLTNQSLAEYYAMEKTDELNRQRMQGIPLSPDQEKWLEDNKSFSAGQVGSATLAYAAVGLAGDKDKLVSLQKPNAETGAIVREDISAYEAGRIIYENKMQGNDRGAETLMTRPAVNPADASNNQAENKVDIRNIAEGAGESLRKNFNNK